MTGGLDDSVPDWKEYFWKVSINPTKTKLDFKNTRVKPIHKGELEYKELGVEW